MTPDKLRKMRIFLSYFALILEGWEKDLRADRERKAKRKKRKVKP